MLLQTDSLNETQSFIDNFFWPLMLLIATFLGTMIWKFFIQKRFKIKFNKSESYINNHQGDTFITVNVSLINKTEIPVNNLQLSNNLGLKTKGSYFTTIPGSRYKGVTVLPAQREIIDNVILHNPVTIQPHDVVTGNIILVGNLQLVNEINLTFTYLDKRITKRISIRELRQRGF